MYGIGYNSHYWRNINNISSKPNGRCTTNVGSNNRSGRRRTNISADINNQPEEGNVFEGWLVDTGASGYKLSLGQLRNGTLDFSQYMVNPYTYNNFEITEEPAEDPDPNAADSIAGFELQDPFGQ
jgi:exosome complex RNA-binding protein Rrp4